MGSNRIKVLACLVVGVSVLWLIVSSRRDRVQPSTLASTDTRSETPDALPGESIDHWRQRVGNQPGEVKDPSASLTVIAYPMSSDGKCVSPVSGELKWNSDHVILVDWEFQEGNSFVEQITYAPYVAKAKGEKIVFPKIEVPTSGSSFNLQESIYWAPNRVLAQTAPADGFELMDPTSLQEPDQEDQKTEFARRLVYPYELWLKGKSPSSQMWIPVKGQPKDACDRQVCGSPGGLRGTDLCSLELTQSRRLAPESDFMTNSPETVVESFYTTHFPRFYIDEDKVQNGRRSSVIRLNEFDMTVWLNTEECQGCSRTSVSIVGDLGLVIREQQQMLKSHAPIEPSGTDY